LDENYDVGHYCKASSPDALKPAQEYVGKCVPVILEELSAKDVSQHGRKMSANYLKQLFEIRDGGQCRVRNTCACFHPLQPKILCINDTPQDWLNLVEGVQGTDDEPLRKRLFFVHIDEPVLAVEAARAHEEDLDALVAQGKRRRLELQGEEEALGSDLTPTSAGSTTPEAVSSGSSEVGTAAAMQLDEASYDDELSLEREPTEGATGASPRGLLPELPLLDRYVRATLVFGAHFLVRSGHLDSSVLDELLRELRALSPSMADAFEHTSHCSISFLTDTTSMKLIQRFLAHGELSPDALYNVVLGQTVVPNWRKHAALGPFSAESPPTPSEFRTRHERRYPGQKAVVPSHLKQGIPSLLGSGPGIDACGRVRSTCGRRVRARAREDPRCARRSTPG